MTEQFKKPKIELDRTITGSRSRSEEEMLMALERLSTRGTQPIPPNYDPPVNIINDCISELLHLRKLREDVLNFIHIQHTKLTRT